MTFAAPMLGDDESDQPASVDEDVLAGDGVVGSLDSVYRIVPEPSWPSTTGSDNSNA
jgi:hypothetical protein